MLADTVCSVPPAGVWCGHRYEYEAAVSGAEQNPGSSAHAGPGASARVGFSFILLPFILSDVVARYLRLADSPDWECFSLCLCLIRWAVTNRQRLLDLNSSLEFKLHRLYFISLLSGGIGKQMEALQYARHFQPFASQHQRGQQRRAPPARRT